MQPLRRTAPVVLCFLLCPVTAMLASANAASAAVVFGMYNERLPRETGATLDRFKLETGLAPQIAMYYRDWNPRWSTALVDPSIVAPAATRGALPMITWEPFLSSGAPGVQPGYAPARIAAGDLDGYISRAAREAAAYGRPLFVRLAHEMNGDWSPWGVRPGSSPSDYVAMWRHVVGIFRAAGALNVRWVWSPNVTGAASVAPFAAYYPGDAWVDEVGLDGYNWGPVKSSPWLTFAQVFLPSYQALTRLTSKPLLITETASTELGGSKAAWISSIGGALASNLPRVRALIWFDRAQEADWPLSSSPASLRSFQALARTGTLSGRATELLAPVVPAVTQKRGSAAAREHSRARSRRAQRRSRPPSRALLVPRAFARGF
jgi:hypothetical protein